MMRISREKTFFGRARTCLLGRMKAGFSKEGRISALDMFRYFQYRSVRCAA